MEAACGVKEAHRAHSNFLNYYSKICIGVNPPQNAPSHFAHTSPLSEAVLPVLFKGCL